MKSFIAALRSLVLPFGRTSGPRVILDGDNGRIQVYDASNTLIAEISPAADVIKALSATGVYAKLDPSTASGIADTPGPGLALGGMSGDTEPGTLTEWDDGFSRGLYLRTPSPVADPGAAEGEDYAAIRMTGRFHGSVPLIQLLARRAGSTVSINDTVFSNTGRQTSYAGNAWDSYTPAVTGGGTAHFSTQVGWWRPRGDSIEGEFYLVADVAGSGTTPITVALPVMPFRDGNGFNTTRQGFHVHAGGVLAGSNSSVSGAFTGLILAGGTSAVADRITGPTAIDMRGDNIGTSTIITGNFQYRAA